MRTTAIALTVVAACLLFAANAAANPLIMWWLRDSPVGAPNGLWDDQWSGGTVYPEGELAFWEDPGYEPGCEEFEAENSFVRLGDESDPLRAYLEPPFSGTQVAGEAIGGFSFRQTTPEVAVVHVELYKVQLDGSYPEYIGGSVHEVIDLPPWPPSYLEFSLGSVPEMEMMSERFVVLIYSDGQYTDMVWDCTYWGGWILLPQEPFNPVEAMNWSTIKALYR